MDETSVWWKFLISIQIHQKKTASKSNTGGVGTGNDFEDVATVAFLFIGEKYLNAIGSKDWVEWVDLNSLSEN